MEKEQSAFQPEVGKGEDKFKGIIADEALKAMDSGDKKEINKPFLTRLPDGTIITAKTKKEIIESIKSYREGGL